MRISLETDGRALFNYPFLNQRMDAVEELLDHPRMAIGLGDSGAHVGLIMDASLPTWFLLHWVRDRGKYTIEDAVRRMTSDTAALFGIADRGVLRAGRVRRRQRDRPRRARAAPPRVRARLPRGRRPLRAARRRLPRDGRQRRACSSTTASPPARTRAARCGRPLPRSPTRPPARCRDARRAAAANIGADPRPFRAVLGGKERIDASAASNTPRPVTDTHDRNASRRRSATCPGSTACARSRSSPSSSSTTTWSAGTRRAGRRAASSASRCSSSSAATSSRRCS